jgi:hypothetical protein
MKIFAGGIMAFALAASHQPAAAKERYREVEVAVPAAPPAITITGPGAPVLKPRRSSGLVVKLQVAAGGEFRRPKDILEAVQFVRRALPPAYLDELAYAHGVARPGFRSDRSKSPRLWELDLTIHLYQIWKLGDRKSKLGRQVGCINWGEFSFQALYGGVVNALREEEELEIRRDLPDDYDAYSGLTLANRLLHICSQVG